MLFIYSVYLSLLLLKHYWSFTLTLAHCLIYIKPPFALCLGIFFVYYTSVANTLVNTDVLPQDVYTDILVAAVAALATACSSTIAFSAKAILYSL
jgi:hypothetical protein